MVELVMRTADGVDITDGMRVWDYDLERGTVDLSKLSDPILGEHYREPDPLGQIWFNVTSDNGRSKLMSDTRVVVRHPFTGETA